MVYASYCRYFFPATARPEVGRQHYWGRWWSANLRTARCPPELACTRPRRRRRSRRRLASGRGASRGDRFRASPRLCRGASKGRSAALELCRVRSFHRRESGSGARASGRLATVRRGWPSQGQGWDGGQRMPAAAIRRRPGLRVDRHAELGDRGRSRAKKGTTPDGGRGLGQGDAP